MYLGFYFFKPILNLTFLTTALLSQPNQNLIIHLSYFTVIFVYINTMKTTLFLFFISTTVIIRNQWNSKTTLYQYLSVFDVDTEQIILLDTY